MEANSSTLTYDKGKERVKLYSVKYDLSCFRMVCAHLFQISHKVNEEFIITYLLTELSPS
jgi:hypothetical protein